MPVLSRRLPGALAVPWAVAVVPECSHNRPVRSVRPPVLVTGIERGSGLALIPVMSTGMMAERGMALERASI